MANPTTAAEWKQVAANCVEQTKQLEAETKQLYADRKALELQVAVLVTKIDNAVDSFDGVLAQNQARALIDQQIKIARNALKAAVL